MENKTYSVKIDGTEYRIRVSDAEDGVLVENTETGEEETVRMEAIDDALYEIRMGNRRSVVGALRNGKSISLVVDGRTVEADVEEARFREAKNVAAPTDREGDLHPVVASIPGQVLKVSVEEGEKVETGRTLLLLSAMKLENEIQSEKAGTVVNIRVEQGETVEKEQVLMEIKT